MVNDAVEATNMAKSGHLELQSIDEASTANPVAADNDSAKEQDSGSEDCVRAVQKETKLSEKRQAQNLKFFAWQDIQSPVSLTDAYL